MSAISLLYAQDFYRWLLRNADLIRQGNFTEVDRENVAEELEAMGKREQRELINRFAVLLAYLLKWQYQKERCSASWSDTIIEQRLQIQQLLEDSPSLTHELQAKIERAYQLARSIAAKETRVDSGIFPTQCPFAEQDMLDENFPFFLMNANDDIMTSRR